MNMTKTSDIILRFENVTKTFGSRAVLDGMNFAIRRGETFVIVGPSGTGKSVTLKHMVRLLTPDDGDIYVGDDCVNAATGCELSALRERFGYLFQGGALLAWLSVGENIALPLREKTKLPEDEIHKRVMRVLGMVEMSDAYDKRPADISGGMCKRAGLARAIITEPEIVLYDEPTSGLDPVTARTIDALIEHLQIELGVTSVVVTHDLHSALSIGSRIAMIHGGKVLELAAPDEFIKSENSEVRKFLKSQYITERGSWERKSK
jgi:phospholipid/cholesterol/gamma-HCH transport system ATP-binding protein